jgi:hypothetical protein
MDRNLAAVAKFRAKTKTVQHQLNYITQLMEGVEDNYKPEDIHYGHVGDLEHVSDILQQAINFMLSADDDVECD